MLKEIQVESQPLIHLMNYECDDAIDEEIEIENPTCTAPSSPPLSPMELVSSKSLKEKELYKRGKSCGGSTNSTSSEEKAQEGA